MTGLTTGFQLSDQQAEMLAELKRYLDKTFPRERECDTSPEWSSDEEYQWCRQYNQQLFDDGWLVPHWPEKYGGRGLTPVDQMLIREEMAYRRVGICNANGLDMLGPILLTLGTEEQKDRHLRKIARMEEMWCQGYSEPDTGSDLTHLHTTAIRDGEEYVVNGSKIWTGHAMHADWMILLARTDPEQRGSKGLSMLLVDLHETDGIEIHPIRSMAGEVTFCQEYFMDARVPVANLVGPSRRMAGGERSARPRAVGRRGLGQDPEAAGRFAGCDRRAGRREGIDRRQARTHHRTSRVGPSHGLLRGAGHEQGRGVPTTHALHSQGVGHGDQRPARGPGQRGIGSRRRQLPPRWPQLELLERVHALLPGPHRRRE